MPGWLKNRLLNLNIVQRDSHRAIHNEYGAFRQWFYGTPSWAKAIEISGFGTSAGYAYEGLRN